MLRAQSGVHVQVGLKIAKFEKSKWASDFSLVYVIIKLGKKITLVKVNFLMGGNAFDFFYLPIVGSKIKIVLETSVTF